MTFIDTISRLFDQPGVAETTPQGAAIALCSAHLVANRNSIVCSKLFRPNLGCNLPVICCCPVGASRLLGIVRDFHDYPRSHFPDRHQSNNSLAIWEPPTAGPKLWTTAEQLAETGFDLSDPSSSEAVLVAIHTERLIKELPTFAKLASRALVVPGLQPSERTRPSTDTEEAQEVWDEFLNVLSWDQEHRVAPSAADALAEIRQSPHPAFKHNRVKAAKLAAVLSVGRQVLADGPAVITEEDVAEAMRLIRCGHTTISSKDSAIVVQAEQLLLRLGDLFDSNGVTEMPMTTVQQRLRRSRKAGSHPVPELIEILVERGFVVVVQEPRRTDRRGGRPPRIVQLTASTPRLLSASRLLLPPPTPTS